MKSQKKSSKINEWKEKAKLIRKLSLVSTTEAMSGHPTSCMSSADITTVLFDAFFTYEIKNPNNPQNDRLILSKGHAAPLLYSLFAVAGAIPLDDLKTLRKIDSPLEGHPTPAFPYSEAATGSLGQGLSIGAGEALSAKKDAKAYKTFVLLGDGEMAEGSVWEAANFASYYKLDNLIAIVDVNRLGQSQETMFGHHVTEYVNRLKAFGWEVVSIDGHNFLQIEKALKKAIQNKTKKPFAIVAKTKKGKGVSFLEDKDGWHGKPVKKEDLEKALKELGDVDENLRFNLKNPKNVILNSFQDLGSPEMLKQGSPDQLRLNRSQIGVQHDRYQLGDEIATREVYGKILGQLGNANPLIFSLDAEVKNSTYAIDFKQMHPDRFVECFIAEQNMVGVAIGLSKRGKIPFVSTFAAFLTRAFDQIRMGAIAHTNVKFVGSHVGVSIGEDGASQMGLEDIAMFGTIPNSVIFHPCDGVSAAKLISQLAVHNGISYLRTLRPKTPVIYDNLEEFKIGGSKVIKSSNKDVLTIAATGITVFEALKAYELLIQEGISVRVVDIYSIKPVDSDTLAKCISQTEQNVLITVEDHYAHGGMGDFVVDSLEDKEVRIKKIAVDRIAHSGTKDELLDLAGISATHIVEAVKSFL